MRSIPLLLVLVGCIAGCQQVGKQALTCSPVNTCSPVKLAAPPVAGAGSASSPSTQQSAPVRVIAAQYTQRPAATVAFAETPLQQPAAGKAAALPQPAAVQPAESASAAASLLVSEPSGDSASGQPAAAPLSLDNILETSLAENPDLVTLRGQVNVTRAVGGVTRAYPWNPFIQSQYFPHGHPFLPGGSPDSSAGLSNYYIWVMQCFELAHQRRYRAHIAAATVTQAQWNVHQAELLSVALTMRLYFAALYQRELLDLARQTADMNGRLLGVVERRFKANLGVPAELTTAKVAARQSRRQADLADATYQAALLALRQQMNMPLDQPLEFAQRLTDFAWASVHGLELPEESGTATAAEGLAAELVQGRPDLMAASAGIRVASANALLARAARVPDIAAGPIYETADDGTQYLGVRFQTDVPILNTGGAIGQSAPGRASTAAAQLLATSPAGHARSPSGGRPLRAGPAAGRKDCCRSNARRRGYPRRAAANHRAVRSRPG